MGYKEHRIYAGSEVNAKTHIFKGIAFADVLVVLIWWGFFHLFDPLIKDGLSTAYMLVNIVVPLILTRPSLSNRHKSMLDAIVFYFARDKKTYHSMEGDYDEIIAD